MIILNLLIETGFAIIVLIAFLFGVLKMVFFIPDCLSGMINEETTKIPIYEAIITIFHVHYCSVYYTDFGLYLEKTFYWTFLVFLLIAFIRRPKKVLSILLKKMTL
jgi:hypothetical protein